MSSTFVTNVAFSCAESVLQSSPETSPEMSQAPTFATSLALSSRSPLALQRTTGGLQSLAGRARDRRLAAAKQHSLESVREEEGGKEADNTSEGFSKPSCPTRASSRAHRRVSLPALQLPSSSSTSSRTFHLKQQPLPMSASLPPSPPESPCVFNFNLPSPGVTSPLSAYFHLTPSSRAPWTEIVDYTTRASTPPYSDEDDGSDEGSCTTPISTTSFANGLDKAEKASYLGLVVPRIEVLPVPQRRAPLPPVLAVNGKPTALLPSLFSGAPALPARRRSSPPTLQQIQQQFSKPTVVRRSTAPSLTFTAAPTTDSNTVISSTSATTSSSRLPSFLLARGARKAQDESKPVALAPASPPALVVVPVFKVTPPPSERGEGGKRVLQLLERRTTGGAPRIIVEEPKCATTGSSSAPLSILSPPLPSPPASDLPLYL